ncbi:MAG TPA: zinc ribbon domain-containing protein, partial [Vicinamibacteria bacterium]
LRTENPVLPYLMASFIIVFTPVLFPAAVLVYKIVRPHEKIGEVYERNLAEEALLAEVEAVHTCPTCARRVDQEWIICPTCRTRLKRVCPNCSRLVGLDWSLCAWCGKDFERREIAAASVTELATATRPTPIEAAASTSLVRAQARGARAGRTATDPLPER